jgi:hypothetical protein
MPGVALTVIPLTHHVTRDPLLGDGEFLPSMFAGHGMPCPYESGVTRGEGHFGRACRFVAVIFLRLECAEGDDGVEPAEGEGVRERGADADRARLIRDVIEVALRIALGEIGGGRQDAMM